MADGWKHQGKNGGGSKVGNAHAKGGKPGSGTPTKTSSRPGGPQAVRGGNSGSGTVARPGGPQSIPGRRK